MMGRRDRITGGSLKEEWNTCTNGLEYTAVENGKLHQSPVDFESAVPADPSFMLDYNKSIAFKMENNGHSVQFNVEEGSPKAYITINEKKYELKQFHFHSVSEH
ncbi:MAG: carbonic anhydrase family protein, partial [Sulfurovum sp.]